MTSSQDVIVRKAGGISKAIFVISLIIVGAGSGVAGYYFGGGFKPTTPTITLNGAGSTFAFPIISALAGAYSKANPNIQVNYQGVGSGAGLTDFQLRNVDFGASDPPLKATDRANITNVIGTPLQISVTIGSIAIGYNIPKSSTSNFPTGLNLTVTVAAEIFQGNITQWNDPAIQGINQGFALPPQPITIVHRADSSGTTQVFTSWLSTSGIWKLGAAKSIQWTGGIGGYGNQAVAGDVQGNKYTIGYVELNYVLSATPAIAYSAVQNHDQTNYVLPSLTTTTYAVTNSSSNLPASDGDWSSVTLLNAPGPHTYPIASFTYIFVFKDLSHIPTMTQTRAQALVNFLWYAVNIGQQQASALFYVPLPQSVVTIDSTGINSMNYNGQALPHS